MLNTAIAKLGTSATSPKLTPDTLARSLRQGCYVCGHCARISRIGQFVEPAENGGSPPGPKCEHCKRPALVWYPPVLDAAADRQVSPTEVGRRCRAAAAN